MQTPHSRIFLALVAASSLAGTASAAPALTASGVSRNAVVTLVPEVGALQPGKPLWIGLHFKLAPEWHTYWKNPGDAGLPARIRWRLPEGFAAGEIQWPRPERVPAEPLMSYGYGNEVLLLSELRTPRSLPTGEVKLGARVDWLECKDACLPGKAELEIALPVASGAARPLGDWAEAFRKARERLPRTSAALKAEAVAAGGEMTLMVMGLKAPKQAYFFPAKADVIEHAAPQKLLPAGKAFRLQMTRAVNTPAPERLEGVLEADGQGYEIQAPVRAGKPQASEAQATRAASSLPGAGIRVPRRPEPDAVRAARALADGDELRPARRRLTQRRAAARPGVHAGRARLLLDPGGRPPGVQRRRRADRLGLPAPGPRRRAPLKRTSPGARPR